MKKKTIEAMMAVLMITGLCMAFFGELTNQTSAVADIKENNKKVIIDAGHGGIDPGKVGINDALEKDINLSIAKKLEYYLKAQDIEVVMTRTDDNGLYSKNASNKKVEDMKRRCSIIENNAPAVTISIHQNSYHEENVKGAQVFYYTHSQNAKNLADMVQNQMIQKLWKENKRKAKANDSYYLLKKSVTPTIIVECGFLSNKEEADLLLSEEYQEKVAWAIHLGIIKYFGNYSEPCEFMK